MFEKIITVLKRVPSLANMPDNVIMALVALGAVAAIIFFIFIVLILFTDFIKIEQKEHKAPDSHRLIMDLQHTLINEMKGTSKQNALMINLTILFILISIVGIIASLMGPVRTVALARGITSSIVNMTGGLGKAIGK